MKPVAIIPARYGSTRFRGKPLAVINGKPMIQRVYERVTKSPFLERVIVATDDKRIYDTVKEFGGEVVFTSPFHKTGTDRVAEVAENINSSYIINVQGDEPLIDPGIVEEIIQPVINDSSIKMVTLKRLIINESDINDFNVVKVVTDSNDFALYFSRFPIPYYRSSINKVVYKHVGIYLYEREFLLKITKMKPTPLEEAEKLEQLRILENGYKIKVVNTDYDPISVDTEEDIKKVEYIMRK
jgi:3-deoxy-manno-octulosonate cytidylyltransferase (CMP-KDO synthetase)